MSWTKVSDRIRSIPISSQPNSVPNTPSVPEKSGSPFLPGSHDPTATDAILEALSFHAGSSTNYTLGIVYLHHSEAMIARVNDWIQKLTDLTRRNLVFLNPIEAASTWQFRVHQPSNSRCSEALDATLHLPAVPELKSRFRLCVMHVGVIDNPRTDSLGRLCDAVYLCIDDQEHLSFRKATRGLRRAKKAGVLLRGSFCI